MESTRQTTQPQDDTIDLLALATVLIKHAFLIISVALLLAIAGYSYSKFTMAPTYQSTTKVYILNKNENTNITYSDVQLGTQLTKDYQQLITSRYVLEEVILELNLGRSYESLSQSITVSSPADTRIVAITVTDTDPVQAMTIANTVREIASEHIQNVMDIDAVNIVETANMPTSPSGPNSVKYGMMGGMAGFVLVAAILVIRYLLDDTIKTSEDIEKYLGLSTLATIPYNEEDNKKKKGKRG